MGRWKAVIFDWNGTLLDDAKFSSEMLETIFSRFGLLAPSLEKFRREVSSNYMEFYYSHGIPRTVTSEDLDKIRADFFMKNRDRIRLRPETEWLLKNCREANLGIALVSAESGSTLLPQLSHYRLLEYFASILTEARPTKKKALLEVVDQFFQIQPRECCYIGDTTSDVREAKEIGVPAVALTNGLGSRECLVAANPDFIANSLTEVWKIIDRSLRDDKIQLNDKN